MVTMLILGVGFIAFLGIMWSISVSQDQKYKRQMEFLDAIAEYLEREEKEDAD